MEVAVFVLLVRRQQG